MPPPLLSTCQSITESGHVYFGAITSVAGLHGARQIVNYHKISLKLYLAMFLRLCTVSPPNTLDFDCFILVFCAKIGNEGLWC